MVGNVELRSHEYSGFSAQCRRPVCGLPALNVWRGRGITRFGSKTMLSSRFADDVQAQPETKSVFDNLCVVLLIVGRDFFLPEVTVW